MIEDYELIRNLATKIAELETSVARQAERIASFDQERNLLNQEIRTLDLENRRLGKLLIEQNAQNL